MEWDDIWWSLDTLLEDSTHNLKGYDIKNMIFKNNVW